MAINIKRKNKRLIKQAVVDMLPLSVAIMPWGILCGTLAISVGLTPLQAQAMSLLIFAGAAQLSSITFIAANVPILPLLSSVFVISSRHILYSFTLRKSIYRLPFLWRTALAFMLTDELFVVVKQRVGRFSAVYALSAGFFFYCFWNVSTLLGIIAGQYFDDLENQGLDFAIIAVFLAMSVSELRKFPMVVCAAVSGASAVYLKTLLPDAYIIIAALLGMAAGYYASTVRQAE